MTSVAKCVEGFFKVKSQLSAQRVLEERICSLVRSFGLLRRSAVECADQKCVVVKS